MKRKLFSAILFGAFLIASTSGLTSCKDYDDDISNLQSQIDKLATADQLSAKVSELQAAISAAQSAAEAKAAAAETVAKAAQSAADAAATAASKAQSTADGASQAAKDAAAAAAAAAEVGKAAQAAVDALEAKAATKEELNAAAEAMTAVVNQITADHAADKAAIEASIETAKTDLLAKINANTSAINDLKARLDAVEAKLGLVEGGEAVDLTEISKEIDAIEEALGELVDAYSTMITSINIFKISNGNNTTTGSGGSSATVYKSRVYNPATGNYDWTYYEWPITYYFNDRHSHSVTSDFVQGFDGKLKFYQVKEKGNVFPKNGETDKSLVFEDGYVRTYEDQVLVRVNPVGAVLKKENISLINSQGKELNGLIEVTDVEKYNGLLTGSDYRTRSNDVENGLWVITFKPVDNYNTDEFKAAAISNNSSVLYAVSVKNTVNEGTDDESSLNEAVDADRRVISEYGLSLWTDELQYWDNFQVSDYSDRADYEGYRQIYDIHNRYSFCETETNRYTSGIEELEWKNGPDVQITADNVVNRPGWDDRQGCALVIAKVGDKIKIHNDGNIKGFYVTLDYKYALESGKSELNAWNSYSYENVTKFSRIGEVIEAGKLQEGPDGYISIKDINDVEGDIIGFRLYAVNLDGTIVNPDGRAFYVGVGTFNNDVELPAQDIAITMDKYLNYFNVADGRPTGNGISSDYIDVTEAFDCDYDWVEEFTITADREGNKPSYWGDFRLEYWTKDNSGKYHSADARTAEYITIKLVNPEAFEDNLDYTLTMSLQPTMANWTEYTTRKVSVTFKKTMPDFVPTFSYITEQTKNQIMVPQLADGRKDYTVANDAKYGFKDLNNVYLFDAKSDRFKSDRYFSYDIAYSDYAWVSGVKQVVSKTVTTDYKMTVAGDFVDNDTEHAVNSTYLYRYISKIWDAEHKAYINGQNNDHSYRVSKATETPLVYMSWAYYNTYRWSKAGENGIPKGDKDNPGKDYAPSVKWLPGGSASLDIDLTKLYVKNSADAATFSKTNLTGYLSDEWLKIKDGSVKTYVGTQVNPYFKPTRVSNSTITLKQVDQNQAAPSAQKHVEKIEFVLIDCFLNEYTVTLDFEVTRD